MEGKTTHSSRPWLGWSFIVYVVSPLVQTPECSSFVLVLLSVHFSRCLRNHRHRGKFVVKEEQQQTSSIGTALCVCRETGRHMMMPSRAGEGDREGYERV